jgi:hypothetical protein
MTREIYFIISSILQNSNASKQRLGQRFAYCLGLDPGPKGSDDGIDGSLIKNGAKIHFQSKLRSTPLDREDARSYFSDISFHKADISIILSGVGFKDTFRERLFGHEAIKGVEVHLLELRDIFEDSPEFSKACNSLPELRSLNNEIKYEIG